MQLRQIKQIIERRGKKYEPALLPEHIHRGRVGECFDTCTILANRHGLIYVEGIARVNKGKWIHHAWLTDGVRAYDPTWRCLNLKGEEYPIPGEYIGIEMDVKDVAAFMIKTGYCSILANGHKNYKLANIAIRENIWHGKNSQKKKKQYLT